jgi:hypothetical protein
MVLVAFSIFIAGAANGDSRPANIEQQALRYIASAEFLSGRMDGNCSHNSGYVVYLIDNFDQEIPLVSELKISHGELLLAILRSGRGDISVVQLNTSLLKGLSQVVMDLAGGSCADAVVSAIPGSNYSYGQMSSLLDNRSVISESNIQSYREELLQRLNNIAFHGFPSVDWLLRADVNPVKLREDARKIALIEALGRFNLPVFLPYGNDDRAYRGETRDINLLSLATNARVFSGLDAEGKHLVNYPYSPLSTGEERAWFEVIECPDHDDATMAHLDINNDGYWDYSYLREDFIAYFDMDGKHSFAPPLISTKQFDSILEKVRHTGELANEPVVLTAQQYRQLLALCTSCNSLGKEPLREFIWLNSERYSEMYSFNPQCRTRGTISGSSLIPPSKLKELLVPLDSRN